VQELVTAGPLAAEAAQAFSDASGRPSHAEADAAAAAERAAAVVRAGDTVLVKASRGVGLEVVAERLARG
jgi:UDP-N-acetylmuramoyl-tripeptide--D-alanyl-D-alanine ligase